MDDCFVFTMMANAPSCGLFHHRTAKGQQMAEKVFTAFFGDQFLSPHPNISDWLEKIKEEQTKTALKIKAAMKPRKQATNEEAESRKRQKVMNDFKSGELTQ
ncbi:hypothetical protein ElyMa_000384800 [Elysia marginata]|uniref:Uncharacterized protein n=1 Tax=Elysia marginata TaxID=1093978 RepID=A0AAV4FIC7_9GAST|nr:hypothetical protein ElyMa_000384800 [Elysia marginata]